MFLSLYIFFLSQRQLLLAPPMKVTVLGGNFSCFSRSTLIFHSHPPLQYGPLFGWCFVFQLLVCGSVSLVRGMASWLCWLQACIPPTSLPVFGALGCSPSVPAMCHSWSAASEDVLQVGVLGIAEIAAGCHTRVVCFGSLEGRHPWSEYGSSVLPVGFSIYRTGLWPCWWLPGGLSTFLDAVSLQFWSWMPHTPFWDHQSFSSLAFELIQPMVDRNLGIYDCSHPC